MSVQCCSNPKNLFCFVCGNYTPSHHKRSIMTKPLQEAYEDFFAVRTTRENYTHGPPSVCNVCNTALLRWKSGMCQKPDLMFGIPMLWSAPQDHATDCYFCLTRTDQQVGKMRVNALLNVSVKYPTLQSAIRPKLFEADAEQTIVVDPQHMQKIRTVLPIRYKTYPAKEQAPVPPDHGLTRHSLPGQTVRSIPSKPTVVTAGCMKRKAGTHMGIMYDVTKVRLRKSEPSIVLERSEKFLPSKNTLRSDPWPVTADDCAPKILNVYSLNKDAMDVKPYIPQTSIRHGAETIEIVDDDEEKAKKKVFEDDGPSLPNKVIKLERVQVKQERTTSPIMVHKFLEGITIKQEPDTIDQKAHHTVPPKSGFINITDLPATSATNGMVVVKMPPLNARPSQVAIGSLPKPLTTSVKAPIDSPERSAMEDDLPHRISQSELILLLRELELSKEKSAILIDRLKRWNLLATQMVGPNRARTVTAPEPEAVKPKVVMAPATKPLPTITHQPQRSSPQKQTPQQPTASVSSLAKMKNILVRTTRTGNKIITTTPIPTTRLKPNNGDCNSSAQNVPNILKKPNGSIVATSTQVMIAPQPERTTLVTRSARTTVMTKQTVR